MSLARCVTQRALVVVSYHNAWLHRHLVALIVLLLHVCPQCQINEQLQTTGGCADSRAVTPVVTQLLQYFDSTCGEYSCALLPLLLLVPTNTCGECGL